MHFKYALVSFSYMNISFDFLWCICGSVPLLLRETPPPLPLVLLKALWPAEGCRKQRSGATCSPPPTFSNRFRSLQWAPENSKDKKKRNLLYITYLHVWTTSEKICMTWFEDITCEFWSPYPHGNNPNTDRSVFLCDWCWTKSRFSLLFSHLSARVLRTSTVAATFSGAYSRNKKKKHEEKKSPVFIYLSAEEPVLGTACRMMPMWILDQGREFHVGFNSAEPHRDRCWLWNQAANKRTKNMQHQFASALGSEG